MTMKNDLQKMNIAGDVERFTENTYNIFSDEEETKFEREDEPSLSAEFEINEYGNIAKQTITVPSGDFITTEYVYEFGLKTEEITENPGGRSEHTFVEYDENQLPISETVKRNGDDIAKTTFFHDDKKQLTEIATLYTNGVHVRHYFTYDERGNKVEEKTIEKSEFTSEERTVYTYNEHNEVTESIDYDTEGNVLMSTQFQYADYDEHGNWTSKTELMDEVPIRTIIRTLQYRR